jgi:prolyl oligopeptidase
MNNSIKFVSALLLTFAGVAGTVPLCAIAAPMTATTSKTTTTASTTSTTTESTISSQTPALSSLPSDASGSGTSSIDPDKTNKENKLAMAQDNADPYLWLEDVEGGKALDWVRKKNAISVAELEKTPEFAPIQERLLKILDSKDRIPYITKYGKYYYNFWRDDKNVRGLWRRTTLEEYKKPNPNWETVFDLDVLAKEEKENWTYSGADVLYPDYDRCLINLARGGADAVVVREFDLNTKQFVKDGFTLPEAKSEASWKDRDTLYVGTDFGPGSMTSSGYPRIVKEWKRNTPLSAARTISEGEVTDVSVKAYVDHDHGREYAFVNRGLTFFSDITSVKVGDQWVKIEKPADAIVRTYKDNILLELRSDWTVAGQTYKSGTLLANNFDAYLKGDRKFEVLFQPTDRTSLALVSDTKDFLVLNELDNVKSRPHLLSQESGKWSRTAMDVPAFGNVNVYGVESDKSNDYFMTVSDFVTPTTFSMGVAGEAGREKLKSQPAFFKSDDLDIQQFQVKSRDGTLVPYFQVGRKGLKLDGSNVTLLNGYGGFEIAMLPSYNSMIGAGWLERGGVYVLANIRGGGEFGPSWHNAARKENRQRAYDDFIAVAEDLIARKVTSPQHLGIEGRSNGGLLMGVMLTQRPDLFGAIHCGSPLLDMHRFNHLLAGASWMDEYGNPDKPEEWAFISKYSPYQNLDASKKYPPILITTSTRDDRVHPGHARKMIARLSEQKHQNLYYENIEGGHGAASNNKQVAFMEALAYSFLWKELKSGTKTNVGAVPVER